MATTNLGRVQGGSIFYSSATSGTSVLKNTLTPTSISPLVGDIVLFSNGDIRKITAINTTTITCGSVLTSIKGATGATGATGSQGPQGPQGEPGHMNMVAEAVESGKDISGGVSGQILVQSSGFSVSAGTHRYLVLYNADAVDSADLLATMQARLDQSVTATYIPVVFTTGIRWNCYNGGGGSIAQVLTITANEATTFKAVGTMYCAGTLRFRGTIQVVELT